MIQIKEPLFEIGEDVFYCTKDSPEGVVLDCHYSMLYKKWVYTVTFSELAESMTYFEHELRKTKRF